MVSLARCLSVLLGQGFPKSGALEYSITCSSHDVWVHTSEVCNENGGSEPRTHMDRLGASSFRLWLLRYPFHPESRNTFPNKWLRFCNGLLSGHLLDSSRFRGYSAFTSLSQTHWDGRKGLKQRWMKIRHRRL